MTGYDPVGGYHVTELFARRFLGRGPSGALRSELIPTGALPKCADTIRAIAL